MQSHAYLFIELAMGSFRDLFANLCFVPCQEEGGETEPQGLRRPSFKEKAPKAVHVAPSLTHVGLVGVCGITGLYHVGCLEDCLLTWLQDLLFFCYFLILRYWLSALTDSSYGLFASVWRHFFMIVTCAIATDAHEERLGMRPNILQWPRQPQPQREM